MQSFSAVCSAFDDHALTGNFAGCGGDAHAVFSGQVAAEYEACSNELIVILEMEDLIGFEDRYGVAVRVKRNEVAGRVDGAIEERAAAEDDHSASPVALCCRFAEHVDSRILRKLAPGV